MSSSDLRIASVTISKFVTRARAVLKHLRTGASELKARAMRSQEVCFQQAGRLAVIATLAACTAGCFQPMYAQRADGKPALRERLAGIEVPQLNYPNASREARVGLGIRNALMFNMYGDGIGASPTHRLLMRLTTTRSSIIVDRNTSLPEVENYGIDVVYELKDNTTDKTVLTGTTFARVSYDIPGQEQRFAKSRGLREAEDRAAKTIADSITTRVSSFFYAGT